MKFAFAALLLLALSANGAMAREGATLSVAEAVARHGELNGRVVRVKGWLGTCQGLSCSLYETLAGARGQGAEAGWLSIGSSVAFDRRARRLRHKRIVLEARLHAVCFNDPTPPGIVEVCADRVEQLQPIRIVRILSRSRNH
jgi:hypothetical protein